MAVTMFEDGAGRRFWRYYAACYRGSYRPLLLGVLGASSQALLLVPIAFLVRYAFEQAIPSRQPGALVASGAAMLALYLANGAVTVWTRYVILRVTKRAIAAMRDDLLAKIYTVPRAAYTRASLEDWHSVIVQDTERLDVMSNALLALFLPSLGVVLALSAVLIALNWFLFVLLISTVPLLVPLSKVLGRRLQHRVRAFHRAFSAFSGGVLFALQMRDLTAVQTAEEYELGRQRGFVADLQRTSRSMAWLQTAYSVWHNTMITATGVLILVAGGVAVVGGTMSLGSLLSFYVAAALLKDAAANLSVTIPQLISGQESLASLYRIAGAQGTHPYHGTRRPPFGGKIALDSVTFAYDNRAVLDEVSLTVRPSEIVALIGPNGAGKSTLTYLILGFYRPQRGQVYADDVPLDVLDIMHLRRQIGVVAQDAPLFAGSIAENISYGCPDAAPERIQRAAELASAAGFIADLPLGYAAPVGAGGVLLSGGQLQRLALARALFRDPALLILDEPTNHLDAAAVSWLLANLRQLDPAPAILIISHHTELVDACDSVYHLIAGRLVPGRVLAGAAGGRVHAHPVSDEAAI